MQPLNPQPHGGAIKQGNPPPPGGWPGAGRPTDKFRELCRQVTAERVESVMIPMIDGTLERDGQKPGFADSRQAYNDLAKLGWGDATTLNSDFLDRVQKIIMEVLQPDENQVILLGEAFTKEFSS